MAEDQRPDESLRSEYVERLQFMPTHLRIAPAGLARANADHRATPEQNAVGGVRGYGAAGKTGNEQLAAVVDASERYVFGDSHRIEHDIGAGVRGEPLDRFVNARFAVVDKMIGAEPSGVLELLGSGRGSDDRGAERLSDLHCREADASGGAKDHKVFGPRQGRPVSRARGKP